MVCCLFNFEHIFGNQYNPFCYQDKLWFTASGRKSWAKAVVGPPPPYIRFLKMWSPNDPVE